ncbi:hypothetical protein QQX98_009482 [Neonectria punicea]|uniref:BZIP domain-containing protein n=1 Tax=Neonectria punicea TaxID=979145 RepID=A0ABR1GSA3_9HYPO
MSFHRPHSKEPPANKSGKLRTPESLALNRENQRRSRARHRDLLDDLQRRVREYERRDAQASLEMQRVARDVAAENVALRALLAARGVAEGEVEAHLRGQGQRRAVLPSPSPVARRGEVTLEPLREALLDPRLDMPHPMQSSPSSLVSTPPVMVAPLVSVPGLSPIAPNYSQPSLPKDCLPPITLPPMNMDVYERGPNQHLDERPELPPIVCRRQGSNTAMDVDQRGTRVSQHTPSYVSRPGSEHLSTGHSKPQSTCQPAQNHQQQPQDPSAPHPPNKMRCVEAADILARLRGNPDDGNSWAALGCSGSNDCTVRNTDLLQLMDEMT